MPHPGDHRRRAGIEEFRRAAADAELGMAWWNALTERARLEGLKAVEAEGRASRAEAWEHWRATTAGYKCEEEAHG